MAKSESTKYRLAEAMKTCMKTTSVDDITIRQIVEVCGVTRQTFYRNFLDKYDLINWYFDKLLLKSFEHMGEGTTVYDGLVKKFEYLKEEHLFFAAAFRSDDQNSLKEHDFELILEDGSVFEKKGKVVSVDSEVSRSTGTVNFIGHIPNPDLKLRSGMAVRVRAVTGTEKDASLVPARALLSSMNHRNIMVVAPDGTPRRIDVQPGETVVLDMPDGKGGTAYRRVTFKRTNSAPTISGQDKALGLKNGSFAENYTVSDVEGDNVVVTEFIDDKQIRSYQATLGQEETIELSRENWLTLTNGAHQLRVEAVDGNFATSVRVWNFSKKETVIAFQFAKPEETDARATKILITPTWHIEGSVARVEACNNAFDDSPAWEDITAQVAINRVYNFLNESKTAEKWGVNVRFTITKNEGYEEEVSISGFGGAYE